MKTPRILQRIKRQLGYYRRVMADPRTPAVPRWLLAAALAYLLSPIDLIPDFIPVIGFLDDLIVVAGLVTLARLLIPKSVLLTHRALVDANVVTDPIDDKH